MMKIAESGSGTINQRHGAADPDLNQNVTDPQHWPKVWKKYHCPCKSSKLAKYYVYRIRIWQKNLLVHPNSVNQYWQLIKSKSKFHLYTKNCTLLFQGATTLFTYQVNFNYFAHTSCFFRDIQVLTWRLRDNGWMIVDDMVLYQVT
jgi:hypothetical protein